MTAKARAWPLPSLNPAHALRARFDRWWKARLPLSDQLLLTQRNVYILPTRPGWMLGATLLVLLVASINYQLNLGYLLTFLLTGCAVVGMHVAHATLRGLSLHLSPPEPQFCGTPVHLNLQLHNPRKSPRYGVGLSVHRTEHWVWTDVPGQGSCTVAVSFVPEQRGWQSVPTLSTETRFPMGTFRVWALWRPAARVLVYPRPEMHPPPWPPGEPRSGRPSPAARTQGAGEFDGVRAYRRGDTLRQVVWKKAANALATGHDTLVSRDTEHSQAHELWLDLAHTGSLPLEQKLSRLCAWVLQADRLGVTYGLRLPGTRLAPASGALHRRQCLEALALC